MRVQTVIFGGCMALLLPLAAHAQGDPSSVDLTGNWYIQGGGGVNWTADQDGTSSDVSQMVPPFPLNGETDTGWLAGGAVGYAWSGGFRTEVEASYRSNDLESLTAPTLPFALTGVDGSTDSIAIMANVLLDIDTGSIITPYVGAGVGAGNVRYELMANGSVVDDDAWGVALQGIAGVSVAVTDRIDLFADYRYLTVLDSDVSGIDSAGDPYTIDDDYAAHSAFFGARYHFLPPPPPPAAPAAVETPPPPPATQDRFVVFFDWDRADLTSQANGVLDEVVVTYNQAGFAQVLAEGHADRSGPAGYNVGLSQRRGESVRQGLIARGVAPDEIVVRAFGESQPLVPTPDGVREPQNRRVEIILM